jgi:Icc-related predicted phosphoesterase
LSDLHVDVHPYSVADATDCDVVVIAGDVAERLSSHSLEWVAREIRSRGWRVVYVPGNHDFWKTRYHSEIDKARAAALEHGIDLLIDGDVVVIDGVRFIGATLWSDYKVAGVQGQSMRDADDRMSGMRDHRRIRWGEGRERFRPTEALQEHRRQRAAMEAALAEPFDGATVVVTHHAPHPSSLKAGAPTRPIDASYASDLTALIETYRPSLWIHGHVHASRDYHVGETRIVANPRGYVVESGHGKRRTIEVENPAHDPELTMSYIPDNNGSGCYRGCKVSNLVGVKTTDSVIITPSRSGSRWARNITFRY